MNDNSDMNDEFVVKRDNSGQTADGGHVESIAWQEEVATWEPVKDQPFSWLSGDEINQIKSRWNSIQIGFVDNPRDSVERADALVEETLERIEKAVSNQRASLNDQGSQTDDISTEDLRIALQSYRTFLYRLLTN